MPKLISDRQMRRYKRSVESAFEALAKAPCGSEFDRALRACNTAQDVELAAGSVNIAIRALEHLEWLQANPGHTV